MGRGHFATSSARRRTNPIASSNAVKLIPAAEMAAVRCVRKPKISLIDAPGNMGGGKWTGLARRGVRAPRLVLATRPGGSGIPRRLWSYAYTPCWAGRAGGTSVDQVVSRPVRVPAHAGLAGLTGSPTPDRSGGRAALPKRNRTARPARIASIRGRPPMAADALSPMITQSFLWQSPVQGPWITDRSSQLVVDVDGCDSRNPRRVVLPSRAGGSLW